MAILNAPNLVLLSVWIQYPNDAAMGGYVRIPGAFSFTPGKHIPPIKVLVLHAYAVGLGRLDDLEHRIQIHALRELTSTPGPRLNLPNFLATLMRSAELRLEFLDIHWMYPGLLNLPTRGWPAVFEAFLLYFKGLKKLALKGAIILPLLYLARSISWHGETLEVLTLHYSDAVRRPPSRLIRRKRATTVRDIEKLCEMCPRLRTLTLGLHFGDDLAIQRSFQHFQALEELSIYSPLCSGFICLLEPRVDLRYVYAPAAQLRSPCLRAGSLNVGVEGTSIIPDFGSSVMRHANDDIKWENEHRMMWHIEYPQFDETYADIKVWELIHHREEVRMEDGLEMTTTNLPMRQTTDMWR